MVDPLELSLSQSTCRTNPSSIVQAYGLGLNPPDQEEHLFTRKKTFYFYITFFNGWLRFEIGFETV